MTRRPAVRCDVPECPSPEEHFPIAQFVLPLQVEFAFELMQAVSQACRRQDYEAVMLALPGHGENGRIYARKLP